MQIIESIKMAWNSIVSNKLRSILTLLGIAIGLFSIIIVMTALGAVQQSVEQTFNSIGSTNFIIQKFPAVSFGPGSWRKYRNRKDLTIKLGDQLKELATLPASISINLDKGGKTVIFGNQSTNPNVTVNGADVEFFKVENLTITEGRGFNQADIEFSRSYCILGADVAEKLFTNISPIGQEVKIENMRLEVIGLFEKRGSVLGQGQDNFVVIPQSVYVKSYGDNESASFTIMAPSKESLENTMDEVISVLRVLRKVPLGQENDFEIITNDQLIGQFNDITKYFKIGAAVVAFIALIAAGVGIMNIMLVSVTERTKEIGIRKAIGARKITIRAQFIVEAIVLSQIGGLIGIFFGVIGGNMVAGLLDVSAIIPYDWILIGLFVTSFVGIVFGVYPAIKASNLDPIEALRYE